MKLFLVILALCATFTFGTAADNGDLQLPICYQDDPNLNECIKESIQSMLPKLHKGNKDLGVPPLDPFIVANSRYDYNNGAIQGSLALKGVKVYGLSRAEIKNVDTKITENGLTSEIEVGFPRIYVEGNYKADVKINDIKMNPRGFFNLTMSNIKVINKMTGLFETNNGEKYLKLNSYDLIPDIGEMKIYASGLLPDPQLNAVVLDFVNQYWPEMYKLMLPETRASWEPILVDATNQFLSTVPFNKLIKESRE